MKAKKNRICSLYEKVQRQTYRHKPKRHEKQTNGFLLQDALMAFWILVLAVSLFYGALQAWSQIPEILIETTIP